MKTSPLKLATPSMILQFLAKPLSRLEVLLAAALSLVGSFAVLNRWVVTPLGLKSYGRIWQNHVSYLDIGFARRSLWGTLLSITGLNRFPVNEYVNAIIIHGIGLFALAFCMAYFMIANTKKLTTLHAFVVFLSPAFVLHLAYSTGTVDYVLALLLFVSCLYIRNFWALGIIAAIGALVHEAYLFFIPFLALNNFLLVGGGRFSGIRELISRVLPTISLPVFAIIAVKAFGSSVPAKTEFESFMRAKLDIAADQHPLWSGFFEIFSSTSDNAQSIGKVIYDFSGNIAYAAIPLLYLFALCVLACRSKSTIGARFLPFYAISLVFPLAISLVATDYLRWICMSSQLCLLSLVTLQSQGILTVNPRKLACLLPFSLVAPFGGAELSHPFPMHQFVLKRLL